MHCDLFIFQMQTAIKNYYLLTNKEKYEIESKFNSLIILRYSLFFPVFTNIAFNGNSQL